MTRREAIGGAIAVSLAAAGPKQFPLAICSETFPATPFAKICETARRIGYTGLEVDASNLGADPAALNASERAARRREMENSGIRFVGFHSFLKAPAGLHLTSTEAATRTRSWDYFAKLIDLCADLGPEPLMILGSGKQRTGNGKGHLIDGLARMATIAAQRKVTILLEPLSPQFTDNVNTLEEALTIVRQIKSPGLGTMLDTHNLVAETDDAKTIVAKHHRSLRHIHLNEMDGRYPGSGNYPFAPLLQALRDHDYSRWLSIEVFDFKPDGETVARNAYNFVRNIERSLK